MTPDRIVFLAIMAAFFNQSTSSQVKLRLGRTEMCMVMFFIICAISLLSSGADTGAGLGRYRWLTTLYNLVIAPFSIYFISKNIYLGHGQLRTILTCVCLIGLYLTLTAIFEHYGIDVLVWPKYIMDPDAQVQFGRAGGPFRESTAMGRCLILTFLCTIMLTIYYKGIRETLLWVVMMLTAVALYFTYTRGPWLAFAIALTILALRGGELRRAALGFALFVFLVAATGTAAKFTVFHGKDTLFSKRQHTVEYRFANYAVAWRMATQNPLFGVGYGKFHSEWENYVDRDDNPIFARGFDGNHNTFLGILAEVGIIAFLLYVSIFYYMIKTSLGLYMKKNSKREFETRISIIFIAMTISYLIPAQTIDARFNQLPNNVLFLFFGIVSNLNSKPVIPEKNG